MRKFYNTVLERRVVVDGELITPPYEAGWADTAIFFINNERHDPGFKGFKAKVQIAANGHDWIDEGTAIEMKPSDPVGFLRLSNFGGWLRLVITGAAKGETAEITVHLSLKE